MPIQVFDPFVDVVMNMDAGSASLCYLVTKLPVELIVGILAILDFRDLLSCRQVSTTCAWQQID